nr:ABC transporter substrate binding protein [Deltaproteobacteria bacterium]
FINHPVAGGVLYIGPDFKFIGSLSGQQAVQILKDGKKPEELPVLRQTELDVYYDPETLERLGIVFPESLAKVAKPADVIE